ncbi:hypothetical protein [Sphingomonas mesophila]|uniref:hypothetical protein n=1 Tax=Sphingomonas mesophila TaxID=2303576 RepID=UPI0013C37A8A|nr:hypothetical protein [Sphingomonas mesophila]
MLLRFTARRRRQVGEWLVELMIVVFGVLIALYAQQWANERQSLKAAKDAETRIREEIYGNIANSVERIAVHRCLRDRLGQIAERLNAGTNDWKAFAYDYTDNDLFLVRRIYRTPSRSISEDAYRGALASGALDSVPVERRAMWSGLYGSFAKMQFVNNQENERTSGLNSLWLNGEVLPGDRRELLQLVARLDRDNGLITLISKQNVDSLKELGYALTAEERGAFEKQLNNKAFDSSNTSLAMRRRVYGNCVDAEAFKLIDPALKID